MSKDILNRTLLEHAKALETREYSSRELTEAYLGQIEEKNKDINAFVTVCAERAIAEAECSDARRRAGQARSLLDGIPCAAKDNISVAGLRLTCGSKMLKDHSAVYDATVIARLSECGAVLLGKTNMDEFAMGTGTESSCFGRTKNPLSYDRVAGGSSGGSAAAVAAQMAAFALGSDTGGSVRQPAAFCGVVGMRPTYSALSRYGLVGFAPSLDTVGILTRDVADCRTVLENIAFCDPLDSTSHGLPQMSAEARLTSFKNKKIAIVKELCELDISADVRAAFEKKAEYAKELGADIVELSIPSVKSAYAAYYTISSAEASSNLSRFDGVRYGYRAKDADTLDEMYTKSRSEGFGGEVKRRILFGALRSRRAFATRYTQERSRLAEE
ncbi:MAG: Asp-tRNA(Asn)/Glu-tRNA(Gln) amidotransferase subunit GatA [Ruminococcaceae bacterium]|nr:Asp-tRNA(Asn)/Glu-tRNA(Gln) amidotransferase subunit GatA [Oscillospiraceae bacterium]